MAHASPATKVAIYVTYRGALLVFDEPDFPDVPTQIPGGTVEAGEDLAVAARRELLEETGLADAEVAPLTPLGFVDYDFMRDGVRIHQRRHFFQTTLTAEPRPSWDHWEMTPSDGSPPIRFAFTWIPIAAAHERLGNGFADRLNALTP